MTTLRDLLNDLITDAIDVASVHAEGVFLTEDEQKELLDQYIEIIKERLIG